jgi:hypothetical protein
MDEGMSLWLRIESQEDMGYIETSLSFLGSFLRIIALELAEYVGSVLRDGWGQIIFFLAFEAQPWRMTLEGDELESLHVTGGFQRAEVDSAFA